MVFPSIIGSSRLYLQQQVYDMSNRYCGLLASGNEMEHSSISFLLTSRQQYLYDIYLLLYVHS